MHTELLYSFVNCPSGESEGKTVSCGAATFTLGNIDEFLQSGIWKDSMQFINSTILFRNLFYSLTLLCLGSFNVFCLSYKIQLLFLQLQMGQKDPFITAIISQSQMRSSVYEMQFLCRYRSNCKFTVLQEYLTLSELPFPSITYLVSPANQL